MCLLTYLPAGTMPDVDALRAGAIFNDDGHGYAIVDTIGNRIIVDRGLDAKEMIESFAVARRVWPTGPAIFHSRLATDGLINLLNTHPFPIGGDSRTVLAHNGIMPLRPSKGDLRSDTRIVAEDHIPRAYGSLRRRRARLAFQRWMRPWNKVVILTVDPRFRDHAFILNEDEGIWDRGIWYSNDMYRGNYPGMGAYQYAWDEDDKLTTVSVPRMVTCWGCLKRLDHNLGECLNCGLCLDCGEMPGRCFCYVPSRRLDQRSALDHLG